LFIFIEVWTQKGSSLPEVGCNELKHKDAAIAAI